MATFALELHAATQHVDSGSGVDAGGTGDGGEGFMEPGLEGAAEVTEEVLAIHPSRYSTAGRYPRRSLCLLPAALCYSGAAHEGMGALSPL